MRAKKGASLEDDVVVGMDLGLGPGGHVEGVGWERPQAEALVALETHHRWFLRGAVDLATDGVAAPKERLFVEIGQIR